MIKKYLVGALTDQLEINKTFASMHGIETLILHESSLELSVEETPYIQSEEKYYLNTLNDTGLTGHYSNIPVPYSGNLNKIFTPNTNFKNICNSKHCIINTNPHLSINVYKHSDFKSNADSMEYCRFFNLNLISNNNMFYFISNSSYRKYCALTYISHNHVKTTDSPNPSWMNSLDIFKYESAGVLINATCDTGVYNAFTDNILVHEKAVHDWGSCPGNGNVFVCAGILKGRMGFINEATFINESVFAYPGISLYAIEFTDLVGENSGYTNTFGYAEKSHYHPKSNASGHVLTSFSLFCKMHILLNILALNSTCDLQDEIIGSFGSFESPIDSLIKLERFDSFIKNYNENSDNFGFEVSFTDCGDEIISDVSLMIGLIPTAVFLKDQGSFRTYTV